VTMYIGDGMMVESPSEGGYVHTEAVRSNGWVGYGRHPSSCQFLRWDVLA